jgi:adenylylsulfate kinase
LRKEKNRISLIKNLLWLFMVGVVAFAAAAFFTGRMELSAMIAGAQLIILLIASVIYEQVWRRFMPEPAAAIPFVLWFTGLSGSGKSTIADRIYEFLHDKGYRVTRLDGDTVRSIFPNTGFTRDERNDHIRRVGYLASILEKNGVIVISSFVSPYAESRDFIRSMCDNFIEVFIATTLEECERRDVKGLYKKARAGIIENFTGINDPYEKPAKPELIINTENRSIGESASEIVSYIQAFL